ncbi:MAG: FtsH protease activity modulator HflK [Gammaproteobacteria bacterium]|nr:MAG: FtsH protease activity modulator HflK [Gammaproteobacteria bacterium]
MAWNEPGGDKRDPWGGRGGSEGPPDLDELARKLRDRMNRFMGGGRGGSGTGTGTPFSFSLIGIILLVVWILSGIYIVDPAERGVVLRLGAFNKITGPGPHWYPRFIDTVEKVNVDQLRTVSHRAKMLTKDENIIQVELAVQYRIKDARDYLFQTRDPDYTLQEATESALREVIGSIPMDDFLTGGRGAIVAETETLIQTILDRYQTGLLLTSVNLQDPQPPEEVQGAFEDAIKAQEDEVRLKNQAEAYAFDILPKARGDAKRLREQAGAYREQVVARAEGETSRFLQTLEEYEKAPEVTRKRLYLETMETVLANTSKVVMQIEDGNSLMYIPLDKLMERTSGYSLPPAGGPQIRTGPAEEAQPAPRRRGTSREGGNR